MRSDLPATTRHVLHVLALHMDGDGGGCFPSIETLKQETGLSNRVVILHLRTAEAAGWLRSESAGRGGQGWKRKRYLPYLPERSDVGSRPSTEGSDGASPPSAERGDFRDENVVTERHTNSTVNSTNIYTDDFERCWKAYPRRAGGNPKRTAFNKYRARLREGVSPEELLDGVCRYAAYCEVTAKTGTEFVKQAATFFGPDEHWREPWTLPEAPSRSPQWPVNGFGSLRAAVDAAERGGAP